MVCRVFLLLLPVAPVEASKGAVRMLETTVTGHVYAAVVRMAVVW